MGFLAYRTISLSGNMVGPLSSPVIPSSTRRSGCLRSQHARTPLTSVLLARPRSFRGGSMEAGCEAEDATCTLPWLDMIGFLRIWFSNPPLEEEWKTPSLRVPPSWARPHSHPSSYKKRRSDCTNLSSWSVLLAEEASTSSYDADGLRVRS